MVSAECGVTTTMSTAGPGPGGESVGRTQSTWRYTAARPAAPAPRARTGTAGTSSQVRMLMLMYCFVKVHEFLQIVPHGDSGASARLDPMSAT